MRYVYNERVPHEDKEHRIGVISDTHGLVRPEALAALAGVELIIHAGDVGPRNVLDDLRSIAPVVAVRGNTDHEKWAQRLPAARTVPVGGVLIHVLHDLARLAIDPNAAGIRVVVSGHSHQPVVSERGQVLYLNPGSAGPRRFDLPIALARVVVSGTAVRAEIVEIMVWGSQHA